MGDLANKRILVFDTETTGKNFDVEIQIIQLAWGWTSGDGEILDAKSFTCKPTIQWSSDWHDDHGLSMKDIGDAPLLQDCIGDFMNDAQSADILMGYNLNFDLNVLELELKRIGIDYRSVTTKPFLDPMIIWEKHERRTLENAHRRWMKKELIDAHDARSDILGTSAVFPHMIREFGLDEHSSSDLISICRQKDDVDRSGKMKWVDNKPVLTCTKYNYFGDGENKNVPGLTIFQVARTNKWYAENYHTFQTVHRSVMIAFRLALENLHNQENFIQEMINEFGPPPSMNLEAHNLTDDEIVETLKSAQGWSWSLSGDRLDSIAKQCKSFTESKFNQEKISEWISKISVYDTHMERKGWIEQFGLDRFAIMKEFTTYLENYMQMLSKHKKCPECGDITTNESGELVHSSGGDLVEEGKTWEDGAWYRLGCDTCDFVWADEVY